MSGTEERDGPRRRWWRSLPRVSLIALVLLAALGAACLGTLPWTSGLLGTSAEPYNDGTVRAARLPPWWISPDEGEARRLNQLVDSAVVASVASQAGVTPDRAVEATSGAVGDELRGHWPRYWLGTDALGRSLLIRCLVGGGISLGVGFSAALIAVLIGTVYGMVAGYSGGRVDAVMMRIVDVLYGLPYILLVVLIGVAGDAMIGEYVSRQRERAAWVSHELAAGAGVSREALEKAAAERFPARDLSGRQRTMIDLLTLLVAVGSVSWLTMSRVIRGQVLSLRAQPFIEACRAIGMSRRRIFLKHLLPNLAGPIVVYATLTVPQAILQESFLSFLGIGVRPPVPSWGNLAAEGLSELNPYRSHWWLLFFPCVLLASTLVCLNFLGEGLRELIDPRRRER